MNLSLTGHTHATPRGPRRPLGSLCVLLGFALAAAPGVSIARPLTSRASHRADATLLLMSARARAGSQLRVTFVNGSDVAVLAGYCFTLQRRVSGRWTTVTHTYGFDVKCETRDLLYADRIDGHTRKAIGTTPLYQSLEPGSYRITLSYERASADVTDGAAVRAPIFHASGALRVLRYKPGPEPHLGRARLTRIATAVARSRDDAHPRLIESAESTAANTTRVEDGQIDLDWSPTYLVAMRGTFTDPSLLDVSSPVILLEVNARTGADEGVEFAHTFPDLSRLGAVSTEFRAPPIGPWAPAQAAPPVRLNRAG